MCGIAGFYGPGTRETGLKMIGKISYRGPDFRDAVLVENVCLAHARLSIIDLSASANQPMFDNDRRLSIVFNGEIYNFKELKEDLIKAETGQFKTSSDTEVLLRLYRLHGSKMLTMLNGMFAFAIYDSESKELFVVRDRMGKKPLYYSVTSDTFVFASELKSVVEHPSVSREIDLDSLNRYLTFDYVPGPDSIIKNIKKLEPGHFLLVKDGRIIKNEKYWKHDFKASHISFDDAVSQFDTLLDAATNRRLISDVPLGVFLSGGIDSSTIAYYAQKNSTQKIKTFSIGFEDASYDEKEYAREVAVQLGTDHHLSILDAKTTLMLIDKIFPLIDEPFADASIIPTFFLSQFTRKSVTVALGGDGSDELLGGYPTFISNKFKGWMNWLPKLALRRMMDVINVFPASDKNISFDFKVKQFLRGFLSDDNYIHQLWLGSFLPDEKKSLLVKKLYDRLIDKSGLSIIDYHFEKSPAMDDFHRTAYYYYQTYLPDDILFKVDRASMYNSLEVRAPFLDVNVVEFLNSLPSSYKQNGYSGKYILKKLMRGRIPDRVIDRPKKGFGIPLSDWIRKDLKARVENSLLSDNEFFDQKYVGKLLSEHQSGKFNHRKLIWNLFSFLQWKEHFYKT